MLKADPHDEYPPEDGRFLRGNDRSPVAVAIILNSDEDKIPPDLEALVRAGVEAGAALAGTVQTPNIGFEKLICNLAANPNIRYLILGGPESEGHLTGQALKALFQNGIDERKRIIGTEAPHPFLYNIPVGSVDRIRDQILLIDLHFEGDPAVIRKCVWSCYQEEAVDFRGYTLFDPGAYPEPPLGGRITWNVTKPWAEPEDDKERAAVERAKDMIRRLRKRRR
jgi:tetrahydromethanopterin S-methyltransferase subunit A